MRAISLWQPWASAIAIGAKAVETRHWRSPFRGLVAIHAAKRWTPAEREFAADMRALGEPLPNPLPLGAIVAICTLVSVSRSEDLISAVSAREKAWGNFDAGRFGWTLEDVSALFEPIPCRGQQGFWELDWEMSQQVLLAAARPRLKAITTPVWELPL